MCGVTREKDLDTWIRAVKLQLPFNKDSSFRVPLPLTVCHLAALHQYAKGQAGHPTQNCGIDKVSLLLVSWFEL